MSMFQFTGRQLGRFLALALLIVGYAGLTGCEHKVIEEDRGHDFHRDYHDDHYDRR